MARKGRGAYNPTERGMFGGAVRRYPKGKPGASYIVRRAGATPPASKTYGDRERSRSTKRTSKGL